MVLLDHYHYHLHPVLVAGAEVNALLTAPNMQLDAAFEAFLELDTFETTTRRFLNCRLKVVEAWKLFN